MSGRGVARNPLADKYAAARDINKLFLDSHVTPPKLLCRVTVSLRLRAISLGVPNSTFR